MKKIIAKIKLLITAGKVTSAPPIGPILGQYGINIIKFCKEINEKTLKEEGKKVSVHIIIYEDKTFNLKFKHIA